MKRSLTVLALMEVKMRRQSSRAERRHLVVQVTNTAREKRGERRQEKKLYKGSGKVLNSW